MIAHFFLHTIIGEEITGGVATGLILAGIGIVWAKIWSVPKWRQRDQELAEIRTILHAIQHDEDEVEDEHR